MRQGTKLLTATWGLAAFLASIVPTLVPTVEAVRSDAHPECPYEVPMAAPLLTDKELVGKYFTMSDVYTNREANFHTN